MYSHDLTSLEDVSNWLTTSIRSPFYTLNGTDDGMYVADTPDLTFGDGLSDDPFSVFALIYPTGDIGDTTPDWLIAKEETDIYEAEYMFYLNHKRVYFDLSDQSSGDWMGRSTGVDLTVGNWYFVCGTYDGSSLIGGIRIYVNGLRADTDSHSVGAYAAMEDTGAGLCVGYLTDAFPATGQNYYQGGFGICGVCSGELNEDEVWALYNTVKGYFGI